MSKLPPEIQTAIEMIDGPDAFVGYAGGIEYQAWLRLRTWLIEQGFYDVSDLRLWK